MNDNAHEGRLCVQLRFSIGGDNSHWMSIKTPSPSVNQSFGGGERDGHTMGNVFDKGTLRTIYKIIFLGRVLGRVGMMNYFLCVLGMVLIVEGLPYFAFPARMKDWIARIAATSERHLRQVGLALMAVGLWLVYLGRS
jgi:hypothetical protein